MTLLPVEAPNAQRPTRTSNGRRLRSPSSAARTPASRRSSIPSCTTTARSSAASRARRATRSTLPYERGGEKFLLIDTAGMRARSKHSTSVEVFSVMRAERTIRRADLCVLVIDVTQRRHIAGQKDRGADPGGAQTVARGSEQMGPREAGARRKGGDATTSSRTTREQLFFLDYAPVWSPPRTGENVDAAFRSHRGYPARRGGAHRHRRSQPPPARRV